MNKLNSRRRWAVIITAAVFFLIGAGTGWWLASGLGSVIWPEPEKVTDYVEITLTCGFIPAVFGGIIANGIYSMMYAPKVAAKSVAKN